MVEVEVINWEKYNPRTDRKTSSWFRLENSIVTEPKFFGLSAAQKFVAVCILAEASKLAGRAKIHVEWLCDQLKIKKSDVDFTIQTLVKTGVVRLPEVTKKEVIPEVGALRTDVRTYDTNERTNEYSSDLSGPTPKGSLPQIAKIWNEESKHLPKVQSCHPTSMRRKHAELRWRENPDEAYWRQVCRQIHESTFLTGKRPDSKWSASFDWLIKPDSATKVLEGKYNQNGKANDDWLEAARRMVTEEGA